MNTVKKKKKTSLNTHSPEDFNAEKQKTSVSGMHHEDFWETRDWQYYYQLHEIFVCKIYFHLAKTI